MEWSIFGLENPFVQVNTGQAGDIPYLEYTPKDCDKDIPTLIYYHGWCSSKDFLRFQAMTVAGFGYRVIVPDALHHGDRGTLDYFHPDSIKTYLWDIVAQSIKESDEFIEHLVKEKGVCVDKIYLLGSSMGAVTAAGIFRKNLNIKGLVGFNGAFAWNDAIEKGRLPVGESHSVFIKDHDLGLDLDCIGTRPILILHGLIDSSLPFDLQQSFYDRASGTAENVKLVEFSNVDHRVTSSMLENLITWLSEQAKS